MLWLSGKHSKEVTSNIIARNKYNLTRVIFCVVFQLMHRIP